MNTTKVIGALLLSMGLAGNVAAENGFYAGASVGQSTVELCGDAGALGLTVATTAIPVGRSLVVTIYRTTSPLRVPGLTSAR
jgi:hypothetical protein